jgi:rare lipoprotein A
MPLYNLKTIDCCYAKCKLLGCLVIFIFSCNLISCNSEPAPASPQQPVQTVKDTQTGLASFYSRSLDGEETASGETFNNNELVAAHHKYPLGTVVRVTNLENDSTVEVRINDRGPTRINRKERVIIDLSQAAAKQLGMMKDGRTEVKVEVLEWGEEENE